MDITSLSPSPNATSYYDRLDVSADDDEKTIEKAGKYAMGDFSEKGTEKVLRLKQARTVLTDGYYRDVYNQFVSEFGSQTGTKAFEDWQQSGEMPVDEFKSRIESVEDESAEDSKFSQLNISNPNIIEHKSDYDGYVNVKLWQDERLYINNLYDGEDDMFIDLYLEDLLTSEFESVEGDFNIVSDGDEIEVVYKSQHIYIDITDNEDWDLDTDNVENVEVSWTSEGVNDVSVNFWSKEGVTPRIYINDYHDYDIYIDTESGGVFNQSTDRLIGSINCNITPSGSEIVLRDSEDRIIKISVITFNHNQTPTSYNETDDKQKEHEDQYNNKEFGYDPKEQDSDQESKDDSSSTHDNSTDDSTSESDSHPTDNGDSSTPYFVDDVEENEEPDVNENDSKSGDDIRVTSNSGEVGLKFSTLFEHLENSDSVIANWSVKIIYAITFPGIITAGYSLSLRGIVGQLIGGVGFLIVLAFLPSEPPVLSQVLGPLWLAAITPLYIFSFIMFPYLSISEPMQPIIGGYNSLFASIPFLYAALVLFTIYQMPDNDG